MSQTDNAGPQYGSRGWAVALAARYLAAELTIAEMYTTTRDATEDESRGSVVLEDEAVSDFVGTVWSEALRVLNGQDDEAEFQHLCQEWMEEFLVPRERE